jgi:hypothetical protein
MAAFIACGGSSDGVDTGPGDAFDAVDIADSGLDSVDTGTDPGVPDTDPGTSCTCDTDDACCDGCLPRNEGQPCGEVAACQVQGLCTAGTCTGAGPLECDAPGPCETLGTCDPETGECVYGEMPDNHECEALAGIPGSGLCLRGGCYGFGDCDHRIYAQEIAFACNFDGECDNGWCQAWGDGWNSYCTRECGIGLAPCPEGTACVNPGDGRRHCRPLNTDMTLPMDGSREAYGACNHNEDCTGELCLGIEGKRFCTQPCEKDGAASDAMCGACGRCRDDGDTLRFGYKFYCVPNGSNLVDEPCGMVSDCAMRLCRQGYCTEPCLALGEDSTCPAGMKCVTGLYADPSIYLCIREGEVDRGFGESCEADWACAEGVCREVFGAKICVNDCAQAECAEGTCKDLAGVQSCVPDGLLGASDSGYPCVNTAQCVDGLQCYRGACLKPCESDEVCGEGGICFPDFYYQVRYCSMECENEGDCAGDRLSCHDGTCVLNANGGSYVLNPCRVDDDCVTRTCRAGLCTDVCAQDLACEGSMVPEWQAVNLCMPCNPNLWGTDCNNGEWGLNECIQGSDGSWFCAPECSIRTGICPVGTRCYSVGGYTQVCAPLSGNCVGTTACTNNGWCIRPFADGMPCIENAECQGGVCSQGFCQKGTCTVDPDCGCELLECVDGACGASSEAGVLELEPNDAVGFAQALQFGHVQVLATLVASDGVPDVDYYRVSLSAGQVLDVRTSPFCMQAADTNLRLLDSNGMPLPGWENDDIDPNGDFFSVLLGYMAASNEDIIIEVTQSIYVQGAARFPYVLDVHSFNLIENSTCDGAIALEPGTNRFDLATGKNDYAAPSCTGWPAAGKDVAFVVQVPAGHYIEAEIDAPFDSQLYAVLDCGQADATCVAGADAIYEAGREALVWANTGVETATIYLIVDSFLPGDDTWFDLRVAIESAEVPDNDVTPTQVVTGQAVLIGRTLGANNDYDPGAQGCGGAALPGADVVYEISLEAGDFLTVTTTRAVGFFPRLWLAADPLDPGTCVAAGTGFLSYTAAEAGSLILVVDGVAGAGLFELDVRLGPVAGCFGPCDPAAFPWACVDGSVGDAGLCLCNEATKVMTEFDCDAYCISQGGVSGTCHTFTAPGFERDSCMCDYDCSKPNTHCEQSIYTKCTCGASDPCGWKDDGYCNEFCSIEYPGDYFDDAGDCAGN